MKLLIILPPFFCVGYNAMQCNVLLCVEIEHWLSGDAQGASHHPWVSSASGGEYFLPPGNSRCHAVQLRSFAGVQAQVLPC